MNISVLNYWINQLKNYMATQGLNVLPYPTIELDDSYNDDKDIFIKTGKYNSKTKTIVLYINNRHIKDILRTLSHELIHHHQFLTNSKLYHIKRSDNAIANDKNLRQLESQAYLLGNIYFRMFTEKFTKNSNALKSNDNIWTDQAIENYVKTNKRLFFETK